MPVLRVVAVVVAAEHEECGSLICTTMAIMLTAMTSDPLPCGSDRVVRGFDEIIMTFYEVNKTVFLILHYDKFKESWDRCEGRDLRILLLILLILLVLLVILL